MSCRRGRNASHQLVMKDVSIGVENIGKYIKMREREITKVKQTPPEATIISKRECTVIHKTLYLLTK